MPKGPFGGPRLFGLGPFASDDIDVGRLVRRIDRISDGVTDTTEFSGGVTAINFKVHTRRPDVFMDRDITSSFVIDENEFDRMLIRFPSTEVLTPDGLIDVGKTILNSVGVEPSASTDIMTAVDPFGEFNLWVVSEGLTGAGMHIALSQGQIGEDTDNALDIMGSMVNKYREIEGEL